MKTFRIVCAAAVLFAGMIASASAGERAASVSKSTLGSMGLGGMHQMSDNDGLAVRGKGTSASVWGSGIATIHGTATQTSGYSASASHPFGSSSAIGGNSNLVNVTHGSVGGSVSFLVVTAIGGSFASAK